MWGYAWCHKKYILLPFIFFSINVTSKLEIFNIFKANKINIKKRNFEVLVFKSRRSLWGHAWNSLESIFLYFKSPSDLKTAKQNRQNTYGSPCSVSVNNCIENWKYLSPKFVSIEPSKSLSREFLQYMLFFMRGMVFFINY